jgi:hypothetical protein
MPMLLVIVHVAVPVFLMVNDFPGIPTGVGSVTIVFVAADSKMHESDKAAV